MTSHVALFAKPPRPGAVKTRLSPALPATDAATLVAAFLEDAAARVVRAEGARRILYLDEAGASTRSAPSGARTWASVWRERSARCCGSRTTGRS